MRFGKTHVSDHILKEAWRHGELRQRDYAMGEGDVQRKEQVADDLLQKLLALS